ncbi:unnamed protein product, partial [Mesorhabditis spiculigera]
MDDAGLLGDAGGLLLDDFFADGVPDFAEPDAIPSTSLPVRPAEPPKAVYEDFGRAIYMTSKNTRNPAGYVTWMCTQCSVMKQRERKFGRYRHVKIPRILVVRDILMEDPDRPPHPHICHGKDIVDSIASRAQVKVIRNHAGLTGDGVRIQGEPRVLIAQGLEYLTAAQKQEVRRRLMVNCEQVDVAGPLLPVRQKRVYQIVATSSPSKVVLLPAGDAANGLRQLKRKYAELLPYDDGRPEEAEEDEQYFQQEPGYLENYEPQEAETVGYDFPPFEQLDDFRQHPEATQFLFTDEALVCSDEDLYVQHEEVIGDEASK